ncbi:MAG: hypothetical protein DRJ55_03250 [Thermoprotei archaeon]|nr:MAG: hypothetical protein DRJ55_03250 [Thermoprotei archaeon]
MRKRARGRRPGLIPVGVDFNLRAISIAVQIKRRSHVKEALAAFAPIASRYEAEIVTINGECYLTALLNLNPPPFPEYVQPKIKALAEKYAEELDVLKRLGIKPRLTRPKIPGIPDRKLVAKTLRQALEEAGITAVPHLFNTELAVRIRKAERKWKLAYRHSITGRCYAIGRLVKALTKLDKVTVKVENLKTINKKTVANPKTARWCYATMLRILKAATPPAAKIACINPAHTSQLTPCCHTKAKHKTYRTLTCPKCGKQWHRDILAAINISQAKITTTLQ